MKNDLHNKYIEKEALHGAKNYSPLPVVLKKGEGVYLWDVNDNKYLDMMSAYSAVSHGHSHPEIVNSLIEQSSKLAIASSAFYTEPLADYIEKNDITDRTYLPFAVISRRDESGSREFIVSDLNSKTKESFFLMPNDIIYAFSQYDIDFINSALLADALGLLSEEDKIKIDNFYQEQKQKTKNRVVSKKSI